MTESHEPRSPADCGETFDELVREIETGQAYRSRTRAERWPQPESLREQAAIAVKEALAATRAGGGRANGTERMLATGPLLQELADLVDSAIEFTVDAAEISIRGGSHWDSDAAFLSFYRQRAVDALSATGAPLHEVREARLEVLASDLMAAQKSRHLSFASAAEGSANTDVRDALEKLHRYLVDEAASLLGVTFEQVAAALLGGGPAEPPPPLLAHPNAGLGLPRILV